MLLFRPISQHPPNPSLVPTSSGVAVRRDMSLTSRVFGLFSTANSNQTVTPAGDSPTSQHTHAVVIYDELSHSVRDGDLAVEEEARPPYLHVRLQWYHCIGQG